jgi:hypothetical protein
VTITRGNAKRLAVRLRIEPHSIEQHEAQEIVAASRDSDQEGRGLVPFAPMEDASTVALRPATNMMMLSAEATQSAKPSTLFLLSISAIEESERPNPLKS